jgi:hypothetical protein
MAPRYGGGNEDKDTKDHFTLGEMNLEGNVENGANVVSKAGLGATNDGENFLPVMAPRYGGGHEDLDTIDHFEAGNLVPETAAKVELVGENFAPHYGGEHAEKDTLVRCAFSDRNLLSRVPLDPTHVRLMRTCV